MSRIWNKLGTYGSGRRDEFRGLNNGPINEADQFGTSQIWEELRVPQNVVSFVEANGNDMVDRDKGR
jgi:hypothetical protein